MGSKERTHWKAVSVEQMEPGTRQAPQVFLQLNEIITALSAKSQSRAIVQKTEREATVEEETEADAGEPSGHHGPPG